ncbi:MAG: glycoside hydrolase family 13 domain protein [Gemmatimonadetes bacterium]|nr:glycoside hydrolase family 13 domain protein [Gemmatimonadota bacterium]
MREDDSMMREIAKELRGAVPVSASFDARVMANVRRLPRHSRFGLWSRLTTPRTVTVTPLSWGLLAASLVLFASLGAVHATVDLNRTSKLFTNAFFPTTAASKPDQRVQFVLVAPDAKKVSVVGDFNGWDASHVSFQAQHRGGGVWSVTAPVPIGHHRYSFVVDDSLWVVDPTAPRVVDNDYGMANSAIVVEEQK